MMPSFHARLRSCSTQLLGSAALVMATACSTPGSAASAGPAAPETSAATSPLPQLGKSPVEDVIAAMTRDEKVRLVMGTGMDVQNLPPDIQPPAGAQSKSRVPGSAAETFPIPRLGIPGIVLADGPAGLRINPQRDDAPGSSYYCTAFPIATALASSWDPSLLERVGKAMGAEVHGYGVDVLLAPALNIQRIPLGGRNFEYYSEDPLLSGSMAAAMVRGVQSSGVGTSIKHFAANNEEWNRNVLDVRVDERALREIYLRGFEIAVREGHPWTVMSSYNRINGTFTSEDPRLLTTILRSEWHFDGLVMTDWFGGQDPVAQMIAGNDVLMPGTERQRKALMEALDQGRLQEAVLDRNIANLLALIVKTPSFQGTAARTAVDLPGGAAVARAAAGEGMVLLKNDKARLPLAKGARLALFGNGSYETVSGGTGSGDVNEAYTVSVAKGLAAAGFATDTALTERYESHLATENAKRPPRVGIEAFLPVRLAAEAAPDAALIERSARGSDAAVITLRRSSGEFIDRPADDFQIGAEEKALVRGVSRAFRAAGKPVILILNVGGPVETASWRDQVDSILVSWQPGQEAGHALSDVLSGAINPSGKLSMTFPRDWKDLPSAQGYPGKVLQAGDNAAPPPFGGAKAAEVTYADGIEVGYRRIRESKVPAAFPFGHGLSYTTFEYGALNVQSNGGAPERWTVTLPVKNTGKVVGAEVVQLYVSAPKDALPKPALELRRFGKTRPLAPGESQTLSFELGPRELASFDPGAAAWVASPGTYTLRAGASSADLRQSAALQLAQAARLSLEH
jgi:beta-glucosidase